MATVVLGVSHQERATSKGSSCHFYLGLLLVDFPHVSVPRIGPILIAKLIVGKSNDYLNIVRVC